MTPGARIAAAIGILDQMADGLAAEQALTRWSRASRYAGSGDRAAVRDHVFDVLRMRRSAEWLGGAGTGRGLMIGLLRAQGVDIDRIFTGDGHAPEPLLDHERAVPSEQMPQDVAWNLPDWLIPLFDESLGPDADAAARALQDRAPVTLRVNLAKTDSAETRQSLIAEGIETRLNPLADTALTVLSGPRKVRNSWAYRQGAVELQDAASQAVVASLPAAARVLDYCAGGGGKALAFAMRPGTAVFAHDVDPARMKDLPARAERAGAEIVCLGSDELETRAPFDLVLCDAPCSGSGAWRRAPEGKWALTPDRLRVLCDIQDSILDQAMALVSTQGTLAYATCSVLDVENEDRVNAFVARHPAWRIAHQHRYPISADGDGFFVTHLTRVS